jgi:hypothetical protein
MLLGVPVAATVMGGADSVVDGQQRGRRSSRTTGKVATKPTNGEVPVSDVEMVPAEVVVSEAFVEPRRADMHGGGGVSIYRYVRGGVWSWELGCGVVK